MPFSDYSTALVTGASGGMGRAIAERLAAKGLTVHGLARNGAKLAELAAASGIVPHEVDVTDTDALEALVGGLEIDVLVNNAGVSRPGSLLQSEAFDIDEQIDVNFRAGLHLARLILPGMMDRDRGHIVNITSMAAHYEFGGHIAYHATKAAMHSYTIALRQQLKQSGVEVIELMPPAVKTALTADLPEDGDFKIMTTEELMAETFKGLRSEKVEIRPGQANQLHWMSRIAPGFINAQLEKGSAGLIPPPE